MNKLAISVSAAALLLGSVAAGMAADNDRGKPESPGQEMLEKGKGGPGGASGIAHERNELRDRDDRKTMDRDDRGTMDRDRK